MKIYIGECPIGVFALDEDLKIIDSEKFPKDSRKTAEKLQAIKEGRLTDEHIELLENLMEEGHDEFVLESSKLASALKNRFKEANFEVEIPNKANKELRKSLRKIAKDLGFENVDKTLQNVNMLLTREELKKEASERDKIIIQAINSIDEIDETVNSLYSRIREWYGIHFPELERHISNYNEYFELILKLGERENFTKENIMEIGISEKKAENIQRDAEDSIGADLDEMDIETIQDNVEKILGLEKVRKKTSDYLDSLMRQIAPNMRTIVGSLIGARLISLAGGLEELAKMPSSTVQVLGAEKALFRSLDKGTKPPKHGVIFQYPEIRGSPKSIRGKIARALAGKLTIAARVDAMSGRYIGERLEEELDKKIRSIKEDR